MNLNSLRSLEETFTALSPPEVDSLKGFYQAESVGPGWLPNLAFPFMLHRREDMMQV